MLQHVAAGPATLRGVGAGKAAQGRLLGADNPGWPRRPAERVSFVSDVIVAYKCCGGDPAF